jgi:hypothetical protein
MTLRQQRELKWQEANSPQTSKKDGVKWQQDNSSVFISAHFSELKNSLHHISDTRAHQLCLWWKKIVVDGLHIRHRYREVSNRMASP